MAKLTRFGVSMDAGLLSAFDDLIERKGYANRSEALRDLVRGALVETQWGAGGGQMVGALCIVYDHHTPDLSSRLTHEQHDYQKYIISSMHVHLDASNCLEVVVLRGPARTLQTLADRIVAIRGVKHGRLIMTTTGEGLA